VTDIFKEAKNNRCYTEIDYSLESKEPIVRLQYHTFEPESQILKKCTKCTKCGLVISNEALVSARSRKPDLDKEQN
jgi:hypothetical protein